MEQYVTLMNTGETDIRRKYDGEYLTVPALGQLIVPWGVMVAWMGDPELTDQPSDPVRTTTYRKLCSFHNARTHLGNQPDLLPKLEAYTPDGDRIITILDDPEGTNITPDSSEPTDIGALQRQIDHLRGQLETRLAGLTDTPELAAETQSEIGSRSAPEGALAEQIAREREGIVGPDPATADTPAEDDDDIPTDSPTKTPVGSTGRGGTAPVKKSTGRGTTTGKSRSAGTAGRRAASKAK